MGECGAAANAFHWWRGGSSAYFSSSVGEKNVEPRGPDGWQGRNMDRTTAKCNIIVQRTFSRMIHILYSIMISFFFPDFYIKFSATTDIFDPKKFQSQRIFSFFFIFWGSKRQSFHKVHKQKTDGSGDTMTYISTVGSSYLFRLQRWKQPQKKKWKRFCRTDKKNLEQLKKVFPPKKTKTDQSSRLISVWNENKSNCFFFSPDMPRKKKVGRKWTHT